MGLLPNQHSAVSAVPQRSGSSLAAIPLQQRAATISGHAARHSNRPPCLLAPQLLLVQPIRARAGVAPLSAAPPQASDLDSVAENAASEEEQDKEKSEEESFSSQPIESGSVFNQMGVDDLFDGGLQRMRIDTPSPIQAAAIPDILKGTNCAIQSYTGSGKVSMRLTSLFAAMPGSVQCGRGICVLEC